MANIFNRIGAVVSLGVGYVQHGLCYGVEKCGSAMQVGGALILGVEVSNYAKEKAWWMQSTAVANLSGQTGKFSNWCEMDPKWLGVFLVATGSVLTLAGNYGKMDVNKIRELNTEIQLHTRLLTANTTAMRTNNDIRIAGNKGITATLGLRGQEIRQEDALRKGLRRERPDGDSE